MPIGSKTPQTETAPAKPRGQFVADCGVENATYEIALLGPILFALSVALQGTITLIFLFGPNQAAQPPGLMEVGRMAARPERDIPLFAAGSFVAVIAMLLCVFLWRRLLLGVEKAARPRLMKTSSGTLALLAFGSFLVYLLMLGARFIPVQDAFGFTRAPASVVDAYTIWLPAILAIGCARWELTDQRNHLNGLKPKASPGSRTVNWTMHIIILLVIAAAVYIPSGNWPALAGSFFLPDKMHHWNYFGMGPALKWANGKAFYRDFYSQYGMGWPMIFVFFTRWLPLTYANMVGEGVAAAALYYCGLYLLLLQLFRKPSWALIGLTLVLIWQVYVEPDAHIWETPSSTVLRNPMDVFCFSCLLLHRRNGKGLWLFLSGALVGLALCFELDTGIYLVITLAFYSAICFILPPETVRKNHRIRRQLITNGLLIGGFCATLLPTLYLSSRGSFLHTDFWNGWSEGIRGQAVAGNTMLPMAINKNDDVLFFVTQITVYLMTIGFTLVSILRRAASGRAIVLACIAVYGMGLILLFVGRSHPYNLLHPTVPFAILLVALFFAFQERLRAALQLRLRTLAPALAGGLCVFLVTGNEFLSYPSALSQWFNTPAAHEGVTIFPERNDLAAVADVQEKGAAQFWANEIQQVCGTARSLADNHDSVVFFDIIDTTLYYGAGLEPWSRYPSLFRQILTHDFLMQVENELMKEHPRYVFIRGGTAQDFGPEQDVWQSLRDCVRSHYTLRQHVGTFELYEYPRLPPTPSGSSAATETSSRNR